MSELISGVNKKKEVISEAELKKLLELIDSVNFGSITLIIQEGKVVQLEKNEKVRLV